MEAPPPQQERMIVGAASGLIIDVFNRLRQSSVAGTASLAGALVPVAAIRSQAAVVEPSFTRPGPLVRNRRPGRVCGGSACREAVFLRLALSG